MIIYNKTIWENNKTPINADNLQKIEDGIEYLFDLNREVPDAENIRVKAETKREQQEGLRQSKDLDRDKKVTTHITNMNNAKTSMQTTVNTKISEVDTKLSTKISEANEKILDVEHRIGYRR